MNLDRAIERAGSVTTPKQAAELYNDIDYELALGEPTSDQEAAGEQAQAELRARFPGVEQQAREVEKPPSTSRTASQNLGGAGGGGRRRGEHGGAGDTRPARRGPRSERGRSGASPRRAAPRSSSSAARRSSSRSSSGPGLSDLAPGFDATDSALFLIRAILLLGLGYFVLTKGAGAFSSVLGMLSGGVQRIVSPVDPLGSSTSTSTSTSAPAASASSPTTEPTASGGEVGGFRVAGGILSPAALRALEHSVSASASKVTQSAGGGTTP